MEIVGLVVLLGLAVLSGPQSEPSLPPESSGAKTNAVNERVERGREAKAETVSSDDLEYDAILTYIEDTYTRTTSSDARAIAKYLVDYANEHDVDPKLAAALIARESSFNKSAVSVTGAKGLGQIKDFNFPSLNISDPHDIKQNVSGTVQYLKEMMKTWQTKTEPVRLALASYYKGPNAVKAVKKDGGDLDAKTNAYVQDILDKYKEISAIKDKLFQSNTAE